MSYITLFTRTQHFKLEKDFAMQRNFEVKIFSRGVTYKFITSSKNAYAVFQGKILD